MAREDDMKLELVYPSLTPDQQELLRDLSYEHPNDIRVENHKDKIIVRARMDHWLGYVKYMLERIEQRFITREEYELVHQGGGVLGQEPG